MQRKLLTGVANLSLVALYGDKPYNVENLVAEAQAILQRELPHAFTKYSIHQVHATLISLEGRKSGNNIVNSNYFRFYRKLRPINFNKVFTLLKMTEYLPFEVKIGGYKKRANYPFSSRNDHPYLRSCSFHNDIIVAMGWPFNGKNYPPTLDKLRRQFNKANILHKYHKTLDETDNDFYFVLGNIARSKICKRDLYKTRMSMIEFLASHDPVSVSIGRNELRIIAYTNPKAPPDTTCSYTLDQAEENLNELKSLYRNMDR